MLGCGWEQLRIGAVIDWSEIHFVAEITDDNVKLLVSSFRNVSIDCEKLYTLVRYSTKSMHKHLDTFAVELVMSSATKSSV